MKVNLIWWKIDPHASYEYDWICFLLSGFEINHVVDFENRVCIDNAIIVANLSQYFFMDSDGQRSYQKNLREFYEYLKKFKASGMNIGLIHLGDEFYRESTDFYKDLNFVFRQYHRKEDHVKYHNCHYIPIGYKSGFVQELSYKPTASRPYRWSFAGHLKGSRFEMMKYANKIPGGKSHATSQWNDPNALNTAEYTELLNNSIFSLCPMGNFSVDCFRVYESLEAGTVPIVEAKGISQALAVLFNPKLIARYGSRDRTFWLRNYQYWERAFPTEFPCPLIYHWKDLSTLIESIDIEKTSEKIQLWWKGYKLALIQKVQAAVEKSFS